MREKRTFAERTRLRETDEVKKKYLLVFEGKDTERIYFEEIDKYRNELGINPLIELVPVLRSYSEEGWSNPKKIVDRILQNLEEAKTGQITFETLLNWIMDYFYDEKILTTSKTEAANMWAALKLICQEKMQEDISNSVNDIEDACTQIVRYFSQEKDLEEIIEDVPKIISNGSFTYASGFDKICFIIDRDRKSFFSTSKNNQYNYVLEVCKKNGFGFYLSNPCFEFWLLLHFDEVKELDQDQLLRNDSVTSKKRYVEYELRKLFPGYTKSSYRAEELMRRIETAIRNEANYCEDERELEHSLGSRVGLLIKEMRM